MSSLSYKTFLWPRNPHTYKEVCTREPQYITQDGLPCFNGMGDMRRVISGSGVFFGEGAYMKFKELIQLMEDRTPGDLKHPVWGIRYCYFTKLELLQEPKDDYVSYQFEFTQALGNGIVPK